MIAKKNDIIKEIQETFPDLDAQEIANAYSFFWSDGVFQAIHDLVHPRIFITKLGTFNFVKSKVDFVKDKYINNDYNYSDNEYIKERLTEFKNIFEKDHEKNNKKREIKNELKKNMGS